MKYLVIALLVLNGLLFVWLKKQSETGDYIAHAEPLSGERLQLLSEASPLEQKAQPPAAEARVETETVPIAEIRAKADTAPVAETRAETDVGADTVPVAETSVETAARTPTVTFIDVACYTLGPFASESGAGEANETLTSLGLVTRQREDTRRELTGHWVYIPPFPSRVEARKVTVFLKARGVKDFQIVSNGPKKNAISLGFFRSRDSAEQHFARISALGLNPVNEESYRENSGLWLDFSSPNRPPLPEAIVDALQQQYGGIAMHERDCS